MKEGVYLCSLRTNQGLICCCLFLFKWFLICCERIQIGGGFSLTMQQADYPKTDLPPKPLQCLLDCLASVTGDWSPRRGSSEPALPSELNTQSCHLWTQGEFIEYHKPFYSPLVHHSESCICSMFIIFRFQTDYFRICIPRSVNGKIVARNEQ